ncbi:hypothetical protein PPN31119_03219 [Pandoraea pnomenusa]|uniref:Putative tail fiber protein gp53-like C-terminal domain-containing protein n=1 Tax=Pandoraea pnomenusa TaxID=93220 RepID=A0ABY6WM05_9BURK|nr:hypothetical protein [Pandoraea pnomenusa]VVE69240.1 hypothetical protein PPN31119_03219 [Pandoraea pnomenusa]
MANTNDFLPFAVGSSANVISQSDYAALTALLANGFQAGTAISAQLNKVWRQSSIMSAMLAQFIVNNSGQDAIDDGTTATLLQNFASGLRAALASQSLGASSITPIPSATTLTASSAGKQHVFNAGVPATLPAASSFSAGQVISFQSLSAGASVVRAGTDVITTGNGTPTSITLNAGDTLTLMSNGTNGWYVVDGSMQLQFAANMRQASSLTLPGYRTFPAYPGDATPLIVQFGVTASPTGANTNATTTFATAFPNAVMGVLLSDLAALSNNAVMWTVSGLTISNFTAFWGAGATTPGSTNSRQAFYIALGR